MRTPEDYLRLAYEAASKSPDPSNQNGAVLYDVLHAAEVPSNNCFTPGIAWTPEQLADREWKLFYIEHAERNAIFGAMRQQLATAGATLYCPWFACADCARAIVLSGVAQVIGHQDRIDKTPDRWKASVAAGLELIRAGGVRVEMISGKLDATPILVNGEIWQP